MSHNSKTNITSLKNEIIKCPNYKVCASKVPQWILDLKNGTCVTCDIAFGPWRNGKGKLEFKDAVECSICLGTKEGVSNPKCDHFICVECFKRCYFPILDKPNFPFNSEKETEYFDYDEGLISKPGWLNEEAQQKINDYFREYEEVEEQEREDSDRLGKCPLCRKG